MVRRLLAEVGQLGARHRRLHPILGQAHPVGLAAPLRRAPPDLEARRLAVPDFVNDGTWPEAHERVFRVHGHAHLGRRGREARARQHASAFRGKNGSKFPQSDF